MSLKKPVDQYMGKYHREAWLVWAKEQGYPLCDQCHEPIRPEDYQRSHVCHYCRSVDHDVAEKELLNWFTYQAD